MQIKQPDVKLALHDLTGFDGRCDAVFFTSDANVTPPNGAEILPGWRRDLLGLADKPTELAGYDLVVVGGGYSGLGAAISAARMGCKVALIQDRPVLGGNGSSEVRVWANGLIRRGRFPRIGEIVEEFADQAKKSPGQGEEFGDDVKASVVRAEKNIDLFLNHFAYQVEMDGEQIRGRAGLRHADQRAQAVHRQIVLRRHGARHDGGPGRRSLRHDAQRPHGHEQHVAVGRSPGTHQVSRDAVGLGLDHERFPVPPRAPRAVVLGERISTRTRSTTRKPSATGTCGPSTAPSTP